MNATAMVTVEKRPHYCGEPGWQHRWHSRDPSQNLFGRQMGSLPTSPACRPSRLTRQGVWQSNGVEAV